MRSKKGLYIHIPFCVRKCNYCDFLSAPASAAERADYIECLKREIKAYASFGYRADTVFFGGGTPSLLSGEEIAGLTEAVRASFRIEEDAELTVECNPETVDLGKLTRMRRAGINRISFGLQSASDRELEILGRIHSYQRFLEAYEAAQRAGFENINIDLMSGLPEQSIESWERTLHKVISLRPRHISAYSLMIEEGTAFYDRQGELRLPEEDEERRMYYRTEELLLEAGYRRYEISNYALPGWESRHNLKYWSGEDYIGLGLGASSCLEQVRFHNPAKPEEYRADCGCLERLRREEEPLTRNRRMEEFCFLGLRRMEGISEQEFFETFGETLEAVYPGLSGRLIGQGLLERNGGRLRLTGRGIDVSNQVMAEFLMDV